MSFGWRKTSGLCGHEKMTRHSSIWMPVPSACPLPQNHPNFRQQWGLIRVQRGVAWRRLHGSLAHRNPHNVPGSVNARKSLERHVTPLYVTPFLLLFPVIKSADVQRNSNEHSRLCCDPPAGIMRPLGTLVTLLLIVCTHGWIVLSPVNVSKALLPTDQGGTVTFLAGRYNTTACDWTASRSYSHLVIQGAGSSRTIIDCAGHQWLHATKFSTMRISGVTVVNANRALRTTVAGVVVEDMACNASGTCFDITGSKTVSLMHISVSNASSATVITAATSITLSHATFQDAQSAGGGGAMQLQAGKALSMTDVTISRAHAKNGDGGAVLITDPPTAATVHMSNIRIDTSSASGQGGAVRINGDSIKSVTVRDLWATNTSAPAGGGALHVSTDNEVHLSNVQMEQCQSSEGESCCVRYMQAT